MTALRLKRDRNLSWGTIDCPWRAKQSKAASGGELTSEEFKPTNRIAKINLEDPRNLVHAMEQNEGNRRRN